MCEKRMERDFLWLLCIIYRLVCGPVARRGAYLEKGGGEAGREADGDAFA